jgi:hypothetical protein
MAICKSYINALVQVAPPYGVFLMAREYNSVFIYSQTRDIKRTFSVRILKRPDKCFRGAPPAYEAVSAVGYK